MPDPRIVGVMQGFAFQERKGSAFYHLFRQLDGGGELSGVVDINIPRWLRRGLKLKNAALDRVKWNAKDQLDVMRYDLLSRKGIKGLGDFKGEYNAVLQIGSNMNLNRYCQSMNIPAFSFHDNNVFAYTRSLPPELLPDRRIQEAIDYEKRVYDGLSGVFTMSKTLARSFVTDFGLPEDKVHYAGFGSPFVAESLEEKAYDQQRILFVASHSFERKGGVTLLNAFRKVRESLPEAQLVLVGRDWNIDEPGVEVHGFLDKRDPVDNEKYQQLFRNASMFVMPSFNEAFGEVFVEAMSHGLPCIGTNTGVMPEIICGNNAGEVIEPGDVEALAENILGSLSDPQALREKGEAGHVAVKSEYTWDKVTGRINEVVSSFL
ncbi:glycosyltransferase family 4 protein [Marinobacter orientalis]|uniref:Glycosyltransferase family 4 protein n=1 Tax=Marinobacter orientalis TaxID=1928859 RepID=A0A7Y0WSD7_9GAMM|nr:glycosyltransferase family 4 protein [Marinobacter orientalis]NMT63789.1 glycosyltransferase family 4 protein [Marinobacter orientalis]TGX49898.1 glycosyltransferase family 1 protein [Marinobacter orientalis]